MVDTEEEITDAALVLAPESVIGYHGCTEEAARSILDTQDFRLSRKDYDWLGEGFYFFEYAPHRAWLWAKRVARRSGGEPAVIQATIQLGKCLNLLDVDYMGALSNIHRAVMVNYIKDKKEAPVNTENGRHILDQDIVNSYCVVFERAGKIPFQTVRGCFPEGEPIYEGSKILSLTHAQIAVRDANCISDAKRVNTACFDRG